MTDVQWDTVILQEMSSGEMLHLLLERYGWRVKLELGEDVVKDASGKVESWTGKFEVIMNLEDLTGTAYGLNRMAVLVAKNMDAALAANALVLRSLEDRVLALNARDAASRAELDALQEQHKDELARAHADARARA